MASTNHSDRHQRERSRKSEAGRRHSRFGESLFDLSAAVLLGTALYHLLYTTIGSLAIPFLRGLFGPDYRFPEGYSPLFGSRVAPLYVEFNGYFLVYETVLTVLGTLLLALAIVIVVIIYARRQAAKDGDARAVEMGTCPECLGPIPVAARRCPYCTSRLQPQPQPGDAET